MHRDAGPFQTKTIFAPPHLRVRDSFHIFSYKYFKFNDILCCFFVLFFVSLVASLFVHFEGFIWNAIYYLKKMQEESTVRS